jgi:hypothetical protein
LASIDERGTWLQVLASDRPRDALDGARELVESLCRAVLRLLGAPLPKEGAGLKGVAKPAVEALGLGAAGMALIGTVDELQNISVMRDSRPARQLCLRGS